MNYKFTLNSVLTSILAASCFLPAANADMPILKTDIQSDNTYLIAGYGSGKLTEDFSAESVSIVENYDVKIGTLNLMRSGHKTKWGTPLISMGATIKEFEGDAKRTDFNIKTGVSVDTGNKRHIFYASYDVRGPEFRDSIGLAAIFRATDIDQADTGLEFELNAEIQEGTDIISGGHAYSVGANGKIMLNSQWHVGGSVFMSLQTDTEYFDGSYFDSSPKVGAELELGFQPLENLQLIGSIARSSQESKFYSPDSDFLFSSDVSVTAVEFTVAVGI